LWKAYDLSIKRLIQVKARDAVNYDKAGAQVGGNNTFCELLPWYAHSMGKLILIS